MYKNIGFPNVVETIIAKSSWSCKYGNTRDIYEDIINAIDKLSNAEEPMWLFVNSITGAWLNTTDLKGTLIIRDISSLFHVNNDYIKVNNNIPNDIAWLVSTQFNIVVIYTEPDTVHTRDIDSIIDKYKSITEVNASGNWSGTGTSRDPPADIFAAMRYSDDPEYLIMNNGTRKWLHVIGENEIAFDNIILNIFRGCLNNLSINLEDIIKVSDRIPLNTVLVVFKDGSIVTINTEL